MKVSIQIKLKQGERTSLKKNKNRKRETQRNIENQNFFFNNRLNILICLFLIASILIVYIQVKNFEFIHYDDDVYITDNYQVQSGLNSKSIRWAFSSIHGSNWHPLTWISHMTDIEIFGMNAGGHHLSNLFFHIINTILLFYILFRMTKASWCSAIVAGLFALHPLHVESVAWISERKDVLSTMFWLLTMWAYIRYIEKPQPGRYILILLSFILGLMSKPMLVTLPFVLLIIDFWPLKRLQTGQKFSTSGLNTGDIKSVENRIYKKQKKLQKSKNDQKDLFKKNIRASHLIIEKIPLFVLTIVSSIITFIAQRRGGAVISLEKYSFSLRTANALVAYVKYIIKMIWPSNLAVLYPYKTEIPLFQIIGAVFILIILSFIFIRTTRKYGFFIVGWLWYLGTLVPVIGLVQVGAQSMADRYTYIPLIGIFILITWGINELVKKWHIQKLIIIILTGIVMISSMIYTRRQARYWLNSIVLFDHTLGVTENNYLMYYNLGLFLSHMGKIEEAIRHYKSALAIKPDYSEALNNLGVTCGKKGDFESAVQHLKEAIRIQPDYEKAHHNLGIVLGHQKKIDEAIIHFNRAIEIDQNYIDAYKNLGFALMIKGKNREAVKIFKKALQIRPNLTEVRKNLNKALEALKEED
jgi:Tfp pilus assembly protein PilF